MKYLMIILMLLFVACGEEGCKEVQTDKQAICEDMVEEYCEANWSTPTLNKDCNSVGKDEICVGILEETYCEGEFDEDAFRSRFKNELINRMMERRW